jgi:hypothetical protein
MKTKIRLSKALKEKVRLVNEMNKAFEPIQSKNSYLKKNELKFDLDKQYDEYVEKRRELIDIKTKVFIANFSIYREILLMAELKDELSKWRNVSTNEGFHQSYGQQEPQEYVVHYDEIFVKNKTEKIQKRIDELQEQIDVFNMSAEIEIEIEEKEEN